MINADTLREIAVLIDYLNQEHNQIDIEAFITIEGETVGRVLNDNGEFKFIGE